MKERPMLFSAPMVRAILDGSKTQTRRIVKPQPVMPGYVQSFLPHGLDYGRVGFFDDDREWQCPFGQPGDQLWVRETWSKAHSVASSDLFYRADGDYQSGKQYPLHYVEREGRWRPSIHMPRWASRIQLEITGVRVERLQDISEADARAEGCSSGGWSPSYSDPDNSGGHESWSAADSFADLWESINGPESWDANPWVWVIEFRRLEC